MKFLLKIIENNNAIYKKILQALLPELESYMDRGVGSVKKDLGNIILNAITQSPEYSSIVGGDLKYELGLVDGSSKVDQLINIWINNIEYNYNKPSIKNNNIRASFSVNAIKSDFSDVLGLDYAQMTDNLRGYSLPWLKWLLLDGSMTIIDNYTVTMGYSKYSRTGNAVMTPSSGSWKVPSQFSGTIGDNWITRAIDNATDNINNLLDRAFKT